MGDEFSGAEVIKKMTDGQVDSAKWEREKFVGLFKATDAIIKTTANLNTTIESHVNASSKFSGKILWLNIILAIATVIMAISSTFEIIKYFKEGVNKQKQHELEELYVLKIKKMEMKIDSMEIKSNLNTIHK